MLFQGVDFSKLPNNESMALYHTMRSCDFFFSSQRNKVAESRLNVDQGAIVADPECCRPCEVRNDYVVYAFYGRPVFRWETVNPATQKPDPYPIFFVFRADETRGPEWIFPFDSGAFFNNIYQNAYFGHSLDDYVLYANGEGVSEKCIPQLIKQIWGSNKAYYWGKVPDKTERRIEDQHNRLSFFDKHYLKTIYSGMYGRADSRAFTFEFIYKGNLPLQSLEAVFFPPATEDEELIKIYTMLKPFCGETVIVDSLLPRSMYENGDADMLNDLDPFRLMFYTQAKNLE